MSDYKFEKRTFMITNYDRVAPFSSFLPGIAGVKGIPLWCFYTNRGQGVNSFGVHDKDHAICIRAGHFHGNSCLFQGAFHR